MTRRNHVHTKRSGVTLIELLVVATIMLTLAAVSVPTIKPMMESQATSHAAQVVSTYLERAKARAAATGRSCGVLFEFFPGTYNGDPIAPLGSASLVLRQVEEPPYFCGYDFGAKVSVGPDYGRLVCKKSGSPYYGMRISQIFGDEVNNLRVFLESDGTDLGSDETDLELNSVGLERRPRIQFGSNSASYPLIKEGDKYYVVKLPGLELPVYTDVSYKISREPTTTMTAPVGIAQGSVIDLEFSGTDSTSFTRGTDVTVMFTPSGEVDYIIDDGEKETPSDTLYFLIGRWDRISALGIVKDDAGRLKGTIAEDGLWNFEDPANYWVAINPQTGVISTAEVNQPFNYTFGALHDGVVESREFARYSKRNIGGR